LIEGSNKVKMTGCFEYNITIITIYWKDYNELSNKYIWKGLYQDLMESRK